MKRKAKKAKLAEKRRERAESPRGIKKKLYKEMSNKGILGQQELAKYSERRDFIVEYLPEYRNQLPPIADCEGKCHVKRYHYSLVNKLFAQHDYFF